MRVIVCGSRAEIDTALVRSTLTQLHALQRITCLVHGCASGVDSDASLWAREHDVPEDPHPAAWTRYGRRAGPLRNEEMASRGADLCIAIHRGTKGTQDMMKRAKAHGIIVREVRV